MRTQMAGPGGSGKQQANKLDPGKYAGSANTGGFRRTGTAAGPASSVSNYTATQDIGKTMPSSKSSAGGYRQTG